ncbi:UbiA family prenyltransferase [Paraburkholderia youngii]|uniref:UbiA family prenyltransferase n=1 Tax=Paraburkholderia youngii TaxID=2782701 RepID=UPI003D1F2F9B
MAAIPLCVDLDGTLTSSDLLIESFFALVKRNPLYLLYCLEWLLRGKAYLKAQIAEHAAIDVSLLPYNGRLIDFLKKESAAGRDLYLCTAGNQRFAEQIARHLGFFKGVMSSNESINLSGTNKASVLTAEFGVQGFDYCGNARADLPVWKQSRTAIVVGGKSIQAAARKVNQTTVIFDNKRSLFRLAVREMRVYQWVKNLLIFVPLLASHRFTNIDALKVAGIAFLSFCLCASSVYILNDMLDLDADRRHSRKCKRPFASGELPLVSGIGMLFVLLLASASLAVFLPPAFQLVLACYVAMTLAYSFHLKRVMLRRCLHAGCALYHPHRGRGRGGRCRAVRLANHVLGDDIPQSRVGEALYRTRQNAAGGQGLHVWPRLSDGRHEHRALVWTRCRLCRGARSCALHEFCCRYGVVSSSPQALDLLCSRVVLDQPRLDGSVPRPDA